MANFYPKSRPSELDPTIKELRDDPSVGAKEAALGAAIAAFNYIAYKRGIAAVNPSGLAAKIQPPAPAPKFTKAQVIDKLSACLDECLS